MKLKDEHVALIARTTLEFLEKEKQKQEKQKYDRRLRNVKLLLRNYRSLAKHCKDIKLEINELDKQLELDELDTDEFKIASIRRSKEKTLAMVKFINKMLIVYKAMCEEEGEEAKRRYQVIYDLYISDDEKTAKEVAQGHSVHYRTIYKYVDKACKDLSVLVFGIDGIRFS